jgi:hypothetical protein
LDRGAPYLFTQALGGLEFFITMIGHRFPKFYNASRYAAFWKCNFWKQKLRMSCKVLCIHIYSMLKMGLFTLTFHCNIIGYRSRRFLYFILWEYLFGIEILKTSLALKDISRVMSDQEINNGWKRWVGKEGKFTFYECFIATR